MEGFEILAAFYKYCISCNRVVVCTGTILITYKYVECVMLVHFDPIQHVISILYRYWLVFVYMVLLPSIRDSELLYSTDDMYFCSVSG